MGWCIEYAVLLYFIAVAHCKYIRGCVSIRAGQNKKNKYIFIRCLYGIFGREITKYAVIYGVYIYGSG